MIAEHLKSDARRQPLRVRPQRGSPVIELRLMFNDKFPPIWYVSDYLEILVFRYRNQ